jgi:hypothetical protein
MDPLVWPCPRRLDHKNETEWIEDNARYFASQLTLDLDVQGMGRTATNARGSTSGFTNRSDVWSVELQARVMEQLRSQLFRIAAMRHSFSSLRRPKRGRLVLVPSSPKKVKKEEESVIQEEKDKEIISPKKEEEGPQEPSALSTDATGPGVVTSTTTAATTTTTTTSAAASLENDGSDNVKKESTTTSTTVVPVEDGTSDNVKAEKSTSSSTTATTTTTTQPDTSQLIPIHLRLSIHGIRIHDDCYWDPSMSDKVTPLDFAQSLGRDLQLAPEAIQAVAVDVAEQVYGSTRNATQAAVPESDSNPIDGIDNDNATTTAAWAMDARTHISHVAHLVAQARSQ